jgi:hypothetical protein
MNANTSGSVAPPVDHAFEAARNRMLALVHHYMSIWDKNTGDAAPLIDLLSPEGFTVYLVTENKTITTIAGVQEWFGGLSKLVKQDNHIVESVDVSALPSGGWGVRTLVRGSGITTQGQPFLVRTDHKWEVIDYGGLMPRITKLTVSLIRDK